MEENWLVYLLKCRDGSLYCGVTVDLERRLEAHRAGKASRCTRSRLPVKLAVHSRLMSRSEALKLEIRVKKAPRQQKITMVTGA